MAADMERTNPGLGSEGPAATESAASAATEDAEKRERRRIDEHWRAVIKHFFYLVLCRIMTALAEDMDRSREVVFLEREMEDLTVYIDGDKQIPDILARVPTQSGREVWLVLHLEIQGPGGGDLPERMFYYNSTLRVKYLKEKGDVADAVSCAILTAKRPSLEEERYLRESYGNRMFYEYPTLKLCELGADELEESENPFDWALCAGKRALESGRNERLKLVYLKDMIVKLDYKEWTHDEKLLLLRLIDSLLHPKSPELRAEYGEFREELRKEGKAMLLSIVEERAQEEGREIGKSEGILIGREETKREAALRMLRKGMSVSLAAECADLPEEEVARLAEEAR